MHGPQPGTPSTAPASRNTSINPSRAASFITSDDAGITSSRVPAATFLPRSTSAAAARSSSRPFVHVPRNACCTRVPFSSLTGTVLSTRCGCATIGDMQNTAEFVEITTAGIRESHVHDVQITKEAPNYRAD